MLTVAAVRRRGRGDRARERDRLRPGGDRLHRRPGAGAARLGAARRRHGLGQLLLRPRSERAVRRLARLGHRPRGRRLELRFLRRREERLHRTVTRRRSERWERWWAPALVAHVPTIMLPEETRLEINDGKEITLVPGLPRLRTECIDRLAAGHGDRVRHALGVDVRAHRDGARTATGALHQPRAAARHDGDPVRHPRRSGARAADRRSRRRAATTRGSSRATTRTCRSSTAP